MSIHPDVLAAKSKRQADLKDAREYRKACGPKKKLPPTLAGQLADVLREHFARALPGNPNRRKRGGHRLPLTAWMLGAPADCTSRIFAVKENQASYPYKSQRASSRVLADRIAMRYKITLVQKSLLYEYINHKYNGQIDTYQALTFRGMTATDCIFYGDKTGELFRVSSNVFQSACEKYHLDINAIPLSAILCENVGNILLLMQINELLKLKTLSN